MKYLVLLLVSWQALAQSSREQQLQFRTQGATPALKAAAIASKGVYEPTQATEAYVLAISKNVSELRAFLRADLPEATQIQTIGFIAKQDERILLEQYAKSKPQVREFILKHLMAKPRVGIVLKGWDAAHQQAFVKAVGTYKASWALPLIQNSGFKTEQIISQLQIQGAKGLPAVWDLLDSKVDVQKIAEMSLSLSANEFMRSKIAGFDKSTLAQKPFY